MQSILNRRQFLGAPILGAAAASAVVSARAEVRRKRPNLVYVFADQLGLNRCGYAGDQHAVTPNIDRLAAQSCDLRQAVSSTPVCAPHRASLMTGKYQSSTGMVINELRLSPEHECIGHALSRGGYNTAYIGKWHLWANELGGHQKTINGFVPPGPYRLGFDGLWAGYNFSHEYFRAPYFGDTPERQIWEGYEPDSQTSMAIDFLRQQAGSGDGAPFALFLSWGPPHNPWDWGNVSEDWAARFRDAQIPRAKTFSLESDPYADGWGRLPANYDAIVDDHTRVYYAQTSSVDENLGRLMRAIEEMGLADDTIFVFTSDHGEMFGAHGRQAKLIFYDEAARVPFLMRWPGKIREGWQSDALLGTPDIMPTLLGLMDLPVPAAVEGADLSGHLLGKGGRTPDAQYLQGLGATANWRVGHEWRAVRDNRYTYAIYQRDGKELLFDNQADPLQTSNLAGDRAHNARLKHFRDDLARWRREHNDNFAESTWYREQWTQHRNIVTTATGTKQDLERLREIQARYAVED